MAPTDALMAYDQGETTGGGTKPFGVDDAKRIGDALGIRWDAFDVQQFTIGLNVELEHGRKDPQTDVTHDDPMVTGKIALAHLKELPDYYTRLAAMEADAGRHRREK